MRPPAEICPVLSIILPCYNPQIHPGWVAFVREGMQHAQQLEKDCELILVNDGSPADLSAGFRDIKAAIPNTRVITYNVNRGKGYAVRLGIAAATGAYIIYTDIDFPYRHESLAALYAKLRESGADLVAGVKDEAYYSNVPFFRRKISEGLRWMIRQMLHIRVTDTQCGLKGFRTVLKPLWLEGKINRYLFDLEMIFNAEQQGYRVESLPVSLREGVRFSGVRMSILVREMRNFLAIARRSGKEARKKCGSQI